MYIRGEETREDDRREENRKEREVYTVVFDFFK